MYQTHKRMELFCSKENDPISCVYIIPYLECIIVSLCKCIAIVTRERIIITGINYALSLNFRLLCKSFSTMKVTQSLYIFIQIYIEDQIDFKNSFIYCEF